jgi:N-acetylmuramoyl-L-alanine amidase
MYISIHNNWASGGTARGTEAFYYTPFSQPLAEAISASVARYFTNNVYTDKSDRNRGAKNSYFWVTVQQDFPSVLLELGFVNNLQDAMALASDRHQNGIADAIVQGIRNYLSRSTIAYSADGFSGIPDNLQPEGSNNNGSDNGENGDE